MGASEHHQSQSSSRRELLQTLNYSEWMSRSIKNSIDACSALLQKGQTFLGSTGATAPFVGLFGTVWGIMESFGEVSGAKGAVPVQAIAPGVAAALITTLLGLLVALPSMIGYNLLVSRLRAMTLRLENFVGELVG